MTLVPVAHQLSEIYGSSANAQAARYARLVSAFEAEYGAKPDFIARAPGRVNIIGEHIDYCGFPVFPMAIVPDCLIAVRATDGASIRLGNIDSAKYPSRTFSVENMFEIDSTVHEWTNYFKCGYRGVLDHAGLQSGLGFDGLVDGTVPAGGGLSSSAAFVCATQLAVQRLHGLSYTQEELASVAASAERHVGVNSGGMDQTASMMGQQGSALFIEFQPALVATPVEFPEAAPTLVFVIANTLVVSDKHVSAPVCYNLRVVETRVGALIMARHLGIASHPACQGADPLTFKAVMDEYYSADTRSGQAKNEVQVWIERLSEMLSECKNALGACPDGYTREDMAAALQVSAPELSSKIHEGRFPVRAERFQLLKRARHVFSEALRVVRFRQICEQAPDGAGAHLGELMNQSQDCCRDLFECSCPELDDVCAIARKAGSLGSRLTGAGWGGCSVHLVPSTRVGDVKKALVDQYYAKRFPALTTAQLDDALFSTAPGCGACYYDA